MSSSPAHPAVLQLRVVPRDGRADRPALQILVDGHEAFVDHLPGWEGFDPDDLIGDTSPLLPEAPAGRRVALYRCSCGIEGCGVVAPVVIGSPDGRTVSWVDFRDYVGVFIGPTADDVDLAEGRPWPLPDLHFARDQYVGEIARACADRSWETPRRTTARLVSAALRNADTTLTMPDGYQLQDVTPAWDDPDGLRIRLSQVSPAQDQDRLVLGFSGLVDDPQRAADDVLDRLTAVPADEWRSRFGRHWPPR